MSVTAIILTLNEEMHLSRCLASLDGVADEVIVVDCFSSDATIEIALDHGARVLQHEWVNHATQFNWALSQLQEVDWVLRIDADEVVTPPLAEQIRQSLPSLSNDVKGVYVNRRMNFLGQPIHYGGVFPIQVLRLFRHGYGECENRWMDEHIRVTGKTVSLTGEIIDDNLNPLTWWTAKHNKYASLEAVEMLNLEYGFMYTASQDESRVEGQAGIKRWLKERVYARLPGGFRALAYFLYRYVVRLGFLDGQTGTAFHVLQGFWYRYLVDAKVTEVKRYYNQHDAPISQAIERVLGIQVTAEPAWRC
ncbi:glycosyltransferase family 2 protein [Halomonas sp. 18H]|nr:glycosyltransferase family 2 protein [Halomonas sp. 18H]MCW4153905.1 glycosyltransferase family 2 protein [Halomonas sp. 18H]